MKSPFPFSHGCLAAALASILLACGVGCTPAQPATKVPSTRESGGEKEQLQTPPQRDPG